MRQSKCSRTVANPHTRGRSENKNMNVLKESPEEGASKERENTKRATSKEESDLSIHKKKLGGPDRFRQQQAIVRRKREPENF